MADVTMFERDTTPEADPAGPGRYRSVMTENWQAPILPHGGIVTAVALRAMEMELARPDQKLRSVTTVFAAQVPPGPVEIDVAVLRRGKAASQAIATVRPQGADAGHTAVAVFGATRPGFEFTDLSIPEVPPPEDCPSNRDIEEREQPWASATFWHHAESRIARGHPWWDEEWEPDGTSERCYWMRFDEPPLRDDGTLDPLAVVALCDTMPGAVGERMGPGQPMWFAPSADLTIHLFQDATAEWLLARNRARHAGEGYASLEMEMWDVERGLIAYATQMMIFSFPDGPPENPHPPV
ncbi:MAG: thioesterase family protein [Actinobacteria bacterium]|nr:thioesterase family protein [Actinomycetota bacterium]